MFEAVLFDLDGTLADTAPDMAASLNVLLESKGRAPVEVETVRPFVSRGARGMIMAAFGLTPEHPDFPALREKFLDIYADNLAVHTRLFPGMDRLLDRLEAEGIAWGVVTNKFEKFSRPVIAHLGLGLRSQVLVSGDTCARPKPFADPLLHACAHLGVAPMKSLYVGDDERDVQAARAAGMKVVVAGYGYLGDGPPAILWGADAVVDSAFAIGQWMGLAANEAHEA
ncbi:phosphoglycolate phosphatase [Usitatibacter palustris]|uniref:phosphoglycolate phosphatase n=1 Tax=Usitatibacter palustris TaxID=2732487 RepID=A0A6M4H8P4_9PROT|nr:phosphoglycolate phosphatase [Usitatibacter palustris]QJR15555.1 N-acetylmuramic acid 6-phosphate phosphatase [Usitatibacter palustris]